jgi:DNA topoisomerase I
MPVRKSTRSADSAAPAKKAPTRTSTRSTKTTTWSSKQTKKSSTQKMTTSSSVVSKKSHITLSTDITKGKHLVIVESPAKAKTISGFLWKDVVVRASYGHVSDLPAKSLWIDVKNNFLPTYDITPEKKKVINELKTQMKSVDGVWIATDEDREWEAIGWHVANALWLPIDKTPRIVFHEITREAIQQAVSHPRTIDMSLVDAQQARRVLDRLVWFTVSPVLWTKIKRGLSAWRVQSVAVKLIIEREREIQAFKPVESWKIFTDLVYQKSTLRVWLSSVHGKAPKLDTYDDVVDVLSHYKIDLQKGKTSTDKKQETAKHEFTHSHTFTLDDIVVKQWKKNPSAPFITSTLQQEASRRFWRSVKQVMQVAQKLYEAGYITYMRTDSTNLSALALWTAKWYILKEFGEQYHQVRQYAKKSKNVQEAHEAIRPSYIDRAPDKSGLSGQELMLYRLIWQRTIASQMASAEVEQTTYHFVPTDIPHVWSVQWEVITFDWFLRIYGVTSTEKTESSDEEEDDIEEKTLPKISKGTSCDSTLFLTTQHFSKPPAHFTESALVKALESRGIWRPSTYAPTIATIQDRWYVEKKDDKKLYPLEIAFHVHDFLEQHFVKLMNYEFTATMEQTLDAIAEGEQSWTDMMQSFYTEFEKEVNDAKKWDKTSMPVWRNCPTCVEWELIYKFTKFGKFIGCNRYPECNYTEKTQEEVDVLAPLKEKYEWKPCPEWWTIVVKIGRFGPFLTSSLYPSVKWISSIPDEQLDVYQAEHGGKPCPTCGKWKLVVKKARRGNYFLACNSYPACKHAENIPWLASTGSAPRSFKKQIKK